MCHAPQAIVDKKDLFPFGQAPVEAFPIYIVAAELAERLSLAFLTFLYVFAQSLARGRTLNLC